jgi:hypothetical protein
MAESTRNYLGRMMGLIALDMIECGQWTWELVLNVPRSPTRKPTYEPKRDMKWCLPMAPMQATSKFLKMVTTADGYVVSGDIWPTSMPDTGVRQQEAVYIRQWLPLALHSYDVNIDLAMEADKPIIERHINALLAHRIRSTRNMLRSVTASGASSGLPNATASD